MLVKACGCGSVPAAPAYQVLACCAWLWNAFAAVAAVAPLFPADLHLQAQAKGAQAVSLIS
jgi:hypothetical protein